VGFFRVTKTLRQRNGVNKLSVVKERG
jgi:hypothetical protein